MFIAEKSQLEVRAKESTAKTPEQLALRLLDVSFTKDQLSKSNCTKADGRILLPENIIEGIRCKCLLCRQ